MNEFIISGYYNKMRLVFDIYDQNNDGLIWLIDIF